MTRQPVPREAPLISPSTLTERLDEWLARVDQGRARAILIGLVFVAGMVFCGWYSVHLGAFDTYDMRSYQFYTPYALLHGRLDFDIGAAQLQTFLNPLPFVPFYLAVTRLEPMTAGFAMGAFHGLSIGFLFLLALEALAATKPRTRVLASLACAGVGAWGPTFLGMMGGSGSDNVICVFVLAALWALLRGLRRDSWPWMAGGATLIGIAAGLKLTAVVFLIGGGVAMLGLGRIGRTRMPGAVLFGVFGLLGILISRGYWMADLWSRYESPLFPFYNAIFKSPYYLQVNFADVRYLPQSFGAAIGLPFSFLSNNHFTELSHEFRDARYAWVYALVLALCARLAVVLVRRLRGTRSSWGLDRTGAFLLVFFVASYVIWQTKFAIMRYIVPLELVAPLVIVLIVRTLVPSPRLRFAMIVIALASVVGVMHPRTTPRNPWTDRYIAVDVPPIENPERTMVLIGGSRPWAYVIPFFPPGVRFVGIGYRFVQVDEGRRHRLRDDMDQAVARHRGDLFMLSQPHMIRLALANVPQHVLVPDPSAHRPLRSAHEGLDLILYRLMNR